jgi:hypothetical protein
MSTGVAEAIEQFTRAYVEAMNDALATRAESLPERFRVKILQAATFVASDGFITFYLTQLQGTPLWFKEGTTHVYNNFAQYDMNAIARGVSHGLVQVIHPRIGSALLSDPLPYQQHGTNLPQGVYVALLSMEFVQTIRSNLSNLSTCEIPISISNIAVVAPAILEKGIVRREGAQRAKIWGADATFRGENVPIHSWSSADFWFGTEDLNVPSWNPTSVAQADLEVIRFLTSIGAPPEQLSNDNASAQLTALCDEFMRTVEQHGSEEEVLHQWLKQHHIFLDSDAKEVRSKVKFGDKTSDFVIRRSDGTYVLCEIETATKRIFMQGKRGAPGLSDRGFDFSPEFTHACQQVKDWQDYIRRCLRTVEDEQDLPGIGEPAGMVVIGRSSSIIDGDPKQRWAQQKQGDGRIRYTFTYDELCERVRNLATLIKRQGSS